MTLDALNLQIAELRSRPLLLLCRTTKGLEKIMTVEACVASGSTYVRIVEDGLDALLAAELEGAPNLESHDKT